MPFARGMRRPPGAGRKKGTTNKIAGEVAERLQELGCDPIKGMVEIAKGKNTPLELRCHNGSLAGRVAGRRVRLEG